MEDTEMRMKRTKEEFYKAGERVEKFIEKIKNSNEFSSENRQTALDFYRNLVMSGKVKSKMTLLTNMSKAMKILSWFNSKDFPDYTEEDIKNIIFERVEKNENYKHNTKVAYREFIKKFFRLIGHPEKVEFIRIGAYQDRKYSTHLTPEERQRLIEVATNPRDRAIAAVGGEKIPWRLEELGTLRIKSLRVANDPVTNRQIGFLQMEASKTYVRVLPIVDNLPYLLDWINVHPKGSDPESYLWITLDKNMRLLSPYRIWQILKELAEKAGIDPKRVYVTAFRHAACTELGLVIPESVLSGLAGWAQGSRRSKTYVQPSQGQIIDSFMKLQYGITLENNNQKNVLGSTVCGSCGTTNQATNKFCKNCHLPTGENIKETTEREMARINLINKLDELAQDQSTLKRLEALQNPKIREELDRIIKINGGDKI